MPFDIECFLKSCKGPMGNFTLEDVTRHEDQYILLVRASLHGVPTPAEEMYAKLLQDLREEAFMYFASWSASTYVLHLSCHIQVDQLGPVNVRESIMLLNRLNSFPHRISSLAFGMDDHRALALARVPLIIPHHLLDDAGHLDAVRIIFRATFDRLIFESQLNTRDLNLALATPTAKQ